MPSDACLSVCDITARRPRNPEAIRTMQALKTLATNGPAQYLIKSHKSHYSMRVPMGHWA
eukprot:scaffold116014_cov16-Prasinocladus_malaysianus.AAC.1